MVNNDLVRFPINDALLRLIAVSEDSNMIHRGGLDLACRTREQVAGLLQGEITEEILLELDRAFISRNLSPGGAADLLGILYFFHELETQ